MSEPSSLGDSAGARVPSHVGAPSEEDDLGGRRNRGGSWSGASPSTQPAVLILFLFFFSSGVKQNWLAPFGPIAFSLCVSLSHTLFILGLLSRAISSLGDSFESNS